MKAAFLASVLAGALTAIILTNMMILEGVIVTVDGQPQETPVRTYNFLLLGAAMFGATSGLGIAYIVSGIREMARNPRNGTSEPGPDPTPGSTGAGPDGSGQPK